MISFARFVALVATVLLVVDPAFAADGAAASMIGGKAAAGLGIGIAALGGALGQAKIAASALDSIGRNPGASGQMFTPMILGLVFVETLVLFTFGISYLLLSA